MDESLMRAQIDKELLAFYDASSEMNIEGQLEQFLANTRKAELAALKDDPAVTVCNQTIPGPVDNPDLMVRIYRPVEASRHPLPCGIFFHGGGFLIGSVYRQNDLCNRYVKNVGCVIVSVEYRLAPQHKAPAPVEDGYAALKWCADNAESLGIDPRKIALIGVSAGGNIAAAVALMTRDRKGPQPILQMPLYAELDHRMETQSMQNITSRKVWCHSLNQFSWASYLSEGSQPDCYASPSLAEDLTGLPPLFSFVGTLDPFCDENIAYWNRMIHAGVPVEGHIYPGGFHCYEISVPDAAISKAASETSYAALKRASE